MDPALIAAIATVAGAGLLSGIGWLAKRSKVDPVAQGMKAELASESARLREELRVAEKDLDLMKESYFMLLQEVLELKSRLHYVKRMR